MKILWYMVPETQGARDNFFCYFGPFYALSPTWLPEKLKTWKIKKHSWRYYHFTHVLHKWKSYDAWFLRCGARQTKLFVILGCFLLFHSPNNPENQNLENTQKTPGDMCIINNNRMMYVSWEMEDDRNSFFVILDHFCPFTPLKTQKVKTLKNWKKRLEISSFYTKVPKINVPEIQRVTDVIFVFHDALSFVLLHP